MEKPQVSVIITTYNGSNVLGRAVDSVLVQTYENFQVIVVDDNDPSSDERRKTESVMKKYEADPRVIYVKHEKNKNGSAARNTGIRAATGKYIAFLDDDDIYFPNRVKICVKELEENPDKDSVLTGVAVTNGEVIVDVIEQTERQNPLRDMFFGNPLGTGSNLFVTRRAIDALGGFDESFLRRQDLEFMVRFYGKFQSSYLSQPLVIKVVRKRMNLNLSYERFHSIEQHFISTFRSIIDEKLSEKDRFSYLNHTYTVLFRCALVSSSKEARIAAKELEEIRPLTKKEKIFLRLDALYRFLRYTPFIYRMKKRGETKKNVKRVEEKRARLSQEEKKYIQKSGAIL